MSRSVVCARCNKRWTLKAAPPPKRLKCPQCAAVIEIESPATARSSSDDADDDALPPAPPLPVAKPPANQSAVVLRQVLAGFEGVVPRRGPGIGYRFALLVTAVAIGLLFVLYFMLLAAAGYGVYWYAARFFPQALSIPGRIKVYVLALHTAVVLGGGLLVYSLLTPLWPRRAGRFPGQKLPVGDAPLLHSFVAKLAESLGAPVPMELRITYGVNASAAYRGGLWGLWRRRLVLSIGAPLIAGMTTQQLGGVIAHELGHFSQRGGLWIRHFVMSFVDWCVEAHGGQRMLAEQFAAGEVDESGLTVILRGVLWVAQSLGAGVAWLMAMLGLLVTGFVSRRQEYDADRYAGDLIGGDPFAATLRRIHELALGQGEIRQRGLSYLMTLATAADGLENFVSEIVAAADVLAERSPQRIQKAMNQPTGWLDSHPSPRDRVAALRKQAAPGIFRVSFPAYKLYPRLNPNPT
jgi:Zn-dependent protease with chaperone function/phage FluMu protein Com